MNKKPPKILTYVFPTFGNILFLVGFFGVLLKGRNMLNADGDFALHLNLGRYILDTGKIPLRDVFSHTIPGQPVTQHEWLSGVIFGLIDRIFGFDGIILLCALVIATTFWLLYKRLRCESQALLTVMLVVLFALINSMVHWLARPHLFTFLLLTLWMMTLRQLRGGKTGRWWILPALMLFWVNLHGGFFIGFVTWLIYGFGVGWDTFFHRIKKEEELAQHFWRYYLLGGFTSLLATLLNPSGIGLWLKVISHLGNKYLADITEEFQSPNFHEVSTWPFLISIGLLILVIGLSNKKPESGELFNTITWLILGLYSGRNIPLFAIIAAPPLGQALDGLLVDASPRVKFIKYLKDLDLRLHFIDQGLKGFFWPLLSILIVIIGLGLGLRFDLEGQGYAFDPEVFPVEAVNWLEDNPQEGEMFNYFTWGGYLQLRLWPEKKVFIDSKSDFYGEQFLRQYGQVILVQDGWEGVLDQYQVSWAILPANNEAAHAIKSELGWKLIYEDDTALILQRQ